MERKLYCLKHLLSSIKKSCIKSHIISKINFLVNHQMIRISRIKAIVISIFSMRYKFEINFNYTEFIRIYLISLV